MKLVVSGADNINDLPGLKAAAKHVEISMATDVNQLKEQLPGAAILLGWNFRGRDLRDAWEYANRLEWIHWCGAGVDAVLFPELVASNTILTNAQGLFDRAIAEFVLGYMLCEVKDFRASWQFQSERNWQPRMTGKLAGSRAVIFGVGSIGREIGTVLKSMGVRVTGVGRTHRNGDPVFETIYTQSGAGDVLSNADWVIGVMPLTDQTRGIFDARFFAGLKPSARFINVGRGQSVNENALLNALNGNLVAGAMLDVFPEEPLPEQSPLWNAPELVISPHMSGDYKESLEDMVTLFLDNLDRFIDNGTLLNIVDKKLGFVRTGPV